MGPVGLSALEHEPRRPPPRSLSDVRDPVGNRYPTTHLACGRTALVLFSARWYGRQDAIHVADAGMSATCVDLDAERLGEMAAVYPERWEFVCADAYAFAGEHAGRRKWDVVSLDPFSQDFERCAALVDLWALLARHVLILGASVHTEIWAPRGWELEGRYHRSDFGGGVQWAVLLRA